SLVAGAGKVRRRSLPGGVRACSWRPLLRPVVSGALDEVAQTLATNTCGARRPCGRQAPHDHGRSAQASAPAPAVAGSSGSLFSLSVFSVEFCEAAFLRRFFTGREKSTRGSKRSWCSSKHSVHASTSRTVPSQANWMTSVASTFSSRTAWESQYLRVKTSVTTAGISLRYRVNGRTPVIIHVYESRGGGLGAAVTGPGSPGSLAKTGGHRCHTHGECLVPPRCPLGSAVRPRCLRWAAETDGKRLSESFVRFSRFLCTSVPDGFRNSATT